MLTFLSRPASFRLSKSFSRVATLSFMGDALAPCSSARSTLVAGGRDEDLEIVSRAGVEADAWDSVGERKDQADLGLVF